jgi:LysR family transcriptional regulator, transcriptional activator of nhaA
MANHALNYNHLYYFHVAATEGSLARAADRLGVTQPTVSEQIRQLERKLAVQLFDRSTAGLRLTDWGRQAYELTTPMFRAGEKLLETLGRAPASAATALRVGVSSTIGRLVCQDLLTPLFSLAGCAPVVHVADLADLGRQLRNHELDLVISESEVAANGRPLHEVELHRPRLVAVAAPSLPVRDAWIDTPMIHHAPASPFRGQVDAFLRGHDLRPTIAGAAEDPGLMLAGAVQGRGIAIVPRTLARHALAEEQVRPLAQLDIDGVTVRAVCHDSQAALGAVERLACYARESLEA